MKTFIALLQTIKDSGSYEPLVMGTADQWESATMGYQNIGPNFWQGEKGRQALIDGTEGYNNDGFLRAFEALSEWQPYLMNGYEATSYPRRPRRSSPSAAAQSIRRVRGTSRCFGARRKA